jgi:hypothetical protein
VGFVLVEENVPTQRRFGAPMAGWSELPRVLDTGVRYSDLSTSADAVEPLNFIASLPERGGAAGRGYLRNSLSLPAQPTTPATAHRLDLQLEPARRMFVQSLENLVNALRLYNGFIHYRRMPKSNDHST